MLKSFADGHLFGRTWGSGAPPVLALHGWRRNHLDFDPVFAVPEFEDIHAALAVDLPGFGATPPPPEGWGSFQYAVNLVPLFDGLSERVTVVGHSFGGRVALHLPGLLPGRIDRLVLTAVPLLDRAGRRRQPKLAFRMGRRLHQLGLVGDRRMESLRHKHGSPDYRAAQGVMRQVFVRLLAEEYGAVLEGLTIPVTLLWGADDTDVPVEVAERATTLLASSELIVRPGAGHLTPTEIPGDLRAAILGPSPA
ncbi:MAG TPA: alpha/beta hydrolase [Acidimicrobiales bacterium]|nr:alpha/beta hydrolase [Acidimicrobiales bacterium]